MSMHTFEKVVEARERLAAAVEAAAVRIGGIWDAPKFGSGNGKVGAELTEATMPLITCSGIACRSCGRECYGVWRMAIVYPACAAKYAHNTVVRRLDPKRYYMTLFAQAHAVGAPVRLNENGDFENLEQLRACFAAARKYSTVRALGYTRRPELLDHLADAPENVRILYSCYRDGDQDGEKIRKAPIAVVSETATTCPAQIAAANGKKWTCAACAANGCGCWGRDCVVFKAH